MIDDESNTDATAEPEAEEPPQYKNSWFNNLVT